MSNKIKALHVISGFGMGGAETWLRDVVKYIDETPELKDQIQIDFLLIGGEPGILDEEVKSYGSILYYNKFGLTKIFQFRKEFKEILIKGGYNVIHSHLDFISGWVFLAGIGTLPQLRISHVHNIFLNIKDYINQKPYRFISYYFGRWLSFFLSNKITGTSESVMNDYGYDKWPFNMKKVNAAYCGVDFNKFKLDRTLSSTAIHERYNISKFSCICLFAGRIDMDSKDILNQKNPEFAFSVAIEVLRENDDWTFIFVGKKGELAMEFEEKAKIMGYSNKIFFVGIRKDIEVYFSGSDIFIFPSIAEGLGMVAVESQATGTTVLASSSVPLEASINPNLFAQLDLSKGPKYWAEFIINKKVNNNQLHNDAWEIANNSKFSIKNSVFNLLKLYHTCPK